MIKIKLPRKPSGAPESPDVVTAYLKDVARQMTERKVQAYNMHKEGMTYEKIAKKLDVPVMSAKSMVLQTCKSNGEPINHN